MTKLAQKWTWQWRRAIALMSLAGVPRVATAGFTKPLRDIQDRVGTGALALESDWSVFGLIGLAVVIGLLAAFYRRDKEE